MFSYKVTNYYGFIVGMQEGFYSLEECEHSASEAIKSNGGTKASIYENDSHVKTIHD